MSGNWVRSDQVEDVAASVRHALRCLDAVEQDPQVWKWFVLALHSSLQGACVCHLTTTVEPIGVLNKKSNEEWLAFLERSPSDPPTNLPKTKLKNLPDLLKAVREEKSAGGPCLDMEISINDQEYNALKNLHDNIRNQFIHFSPLSWSCNVVEMPDIARLTARIISDIDKCGWAFRHMNENLHARFLQDLEALADLPKSSANN